MKIKLGKMPLVGAVPIVIVGTKIEEHINFTTIGDVGIMGLNPPLVYVSLHENHFSTRGLIENREFSINVPASNLLKEVDYCGIYSGKKKDKSQLFKVFFGKQANSPMIEECAINLECEIVKDFKIQHRHIFVANVIESHINSEFVEKDEQGTKLVSLEKLELINYYLDNRYYSINKFLGVGYSEGKEI